ncbi:MAG: hypothetical protein V4457_08310 [Pseudomonadota bacterium]
MNLEPNNDRPKAPEAQEDLKSLPLAELQAKLKSPPDGLSKAEAQ